MDCDALYTDETGRCLKKKVVEHQRGLKNCDRNNGVVVHAWNESQKVDWDICRAPELCRYLGES